MNLTPRLAPRDTYLDDDAYHRLADMLAALRALAGHPPQVCPRTWAVEFLGCRVGVWPASCLEDATDPA